MPVVDVYTDACVLVFTGESLTEPLRGAKGDPGSRGLQGLPGIDGSPGPAGRAGLLTIMSTSQSVLLGHFSCCLKFTFVCAVSHFQPRVGRIP